MCEPKKTLRASETSDKVSNVCRREFLKRASIWAGGVSFSLGQLTRAAEYGVKYLPLHNKPRTIPQPVALLDQSPGGEMAERLRRNMARLESEIYDSDHVFRTTDSGNSWPGDTEGRLVLGVTLEAQALQQTPRHLDAILNRIPSKLNARGLFGAERPLNVYDEQLLSSHGWVLRGLSEYYNWKRDERVLGWLDRMLDSLALPLAGKAIADYPLDPAKRKHGGAESGHLNQQINGWRLSSDTGCIFIFFDGLVQAAALLGRKDMVPVVESLKTLMLNADLAAIKAQTHASLTGLRALCRLYEHERSDSLLRAIQDRWSLYRNTAMTANGENFNWFGRPEWTEPCAVVDSLLVAVHLWRFTGSPKYLEDAHLIYYNGLGAEQRSNGGFGLNSCAHSAAPVLHMHELEATWCCTMRGGEGLSRAAQFTYFTDEDGVVIAFPRDGESVVRQGKDFIKLRQRTGYPHEGWSKIEVLEISPHFAGTIKLFSPGWMTNPRITLNGREVKLRSAGGCLVISEPLKKADFVEWTFQQPLRVVAASSDSVSIYQGPLILGVKEGLLPVSLQVGALPVLAASGSPEIEGVRLASVYHLMNPAAEQKEYGCQVMFQRGANKVPGT